MDTKFAMHYLQDMRQWYDKSAMSNRIPTLHTSHSPNSRVLKIAENSWHLEIPARNKRGYRLAQLDDHGSLLRRDFPWRPPLTLSMEARVSADDLPGTWGFGFWNDPFSFMLAYNKLVPRFPTLPDAAWFFHASPQNYLSIRDDLQANGFLAATFSSKKVPIVLLALASPALALTLIPGLSQLVRRLLRGMIQQDANLVQTKVTEWHVYMLEWEPGLVRFNLDGMEIFHTNIAPHGPMSLVIWVDNQYAALPATGRLRYGTLPNPEPAWMEIRDIKLLENA
jgi:hypothetical protein